MERAGFPGGLTSGVEKTHGRVRHRSHAAVALPHDHLGHTLEFSRRKEIIAVGKRDPLSPCKRQRRIARPGNTFRELGGPGCHHTAQSETCELLTSDLTGSVAATVVYDDHLEILERLRVQ